MNEPVGNSPRDIEIPSNARGPQKPQPKKQASPAPAKEQEERPELVKIITGKVVVKKAPWWKRVGRSMIADDATSVGDYLVTDVIVPAAKRLIADIVQSTTERVLFGGTVSRRRIGGMAGLRDDRRASSIATRYDRIPEETRGRSLSRDQRARHDFNEVTVDSREEAIDTIDALTEYVLTYGAVSVAQLYTLLGVTGSHADHNWGWTDLTTADVRQNRAGWMLDLPAPEPLR